MTRRRAIWPVRKEALPLSARLNLQLPACVFKPWENSESSPKEQFRTTFRNFDEWIIIGATGIAVRYLDGMTNDKRTDPAVVVLDEGAHFAVSLLGGHEGGANALAFQVAAICGAVPVVTTASESLKTLVVGVGCRKGSSAAAIEEAVRAALAERLLSEVRLVATIDLKKDEPGLLEFCHHHQLPLQIFHRDDVAARAWVSNPSAWVKQITGAEGVCEPCALMASPRGRLVVPKHIQNGITVAVVADEFQS